MMKWTTIRLSQDVSFYIDQEPLDLADALGFGHVKTLGY